MGARKNYDNLKITHKFADGRVMTDEEFMAHPVVIDLTKNPEVADEIRHILIPGYAEIKRARFNAKVREDARRRLLEQQAAIEQALKDTK